jgi:addiction module HigA family antidote
MTVSLLPMHPGAVLDELYLVPLGLSAGALAKRIGVPRTRIERIVAGKTAMSTDTALRLARLFSTTPQFWINLQTGYDLRVAAAANHPALSAITPLALHEAAE